MQDDPTQPVSSDDLVRAARGSVGSNESLSEQMLNEARDRVESDIAAGTMPEFTFPEPEIADTAPAPEPKAASRPATPLPPAGSSSPPTSRPRRSSRRPAPPPATSPDPFDQTTKRRLPRAARGLIPLIIFGVILLSNFFGGDDERPDAVPVTVTVATQAPSGVEVGADVPSVNLALNRPVTASGATPDGPATNVVDGAPGTAWNSGGFPPQWIGVDLGAPATIREIRLRVGQNPASAETLHGIFGSGPGTDGEWLLLHEFAGNTTDSTWIRAKLDAPWPGIDDIRILTVESPSWVSWFEIEVLGVQE